MNVDEKDEEKKDVPDESGANKLASATDEQKASSLFSGLKNVVADTVEKGKFAKEGFKKSQLKGKLDKVSGKTKQILDESGITEKATKAYRETQDHLDSVSGAKTFALVEERLAIQEQYNNILATRLHEALLRIEKLEDYLSKRDSS